MFISGANVVMFIGIFLIAEAIFSIVYYFEGSPLPHIFRAIRAIFGAYLVWAGAYYAINRSIGLYWSQLAFFVVVGLCILAGYEVALIVEKDRNGEEDRDAEVGAEAEKDIESMQEE